MASYELSRLNIFGQINDKTPRCVILEIAHCMGCILKEELLEKENYINQIVVTINNYKFKIVNEKEYGKNEIHGFSKKDLIYVGQFVNPDVKILWHEKEIIMAFRHLMLFYKNNVNIDEIGEISQGQKTPDSIEAFNCCMLYKLCYFNGIKTNRNTTMTEMSQALRFYKQPSESLRESLNLIINQFPKNELVNLIVSNELKIAPTPNVRSSRPKALQHKTIFSKESEVNYSIEELNNAHKNLTDINKLWLIIEPHNHEESIILAAHIYFINLTECRNPYNEYMEMKKISENTVGSNKYMPVDDMEFKRKFLINPTWYNIKKTWTPKIPKLYNNDNLITFAKAEGYEEELKNGREPEEILHESRILPNFYIGEHPDLHKIQKRDVCITSIEMDLSNEINRKLIVSYGIVSDSNFVLYKISELIECFSNSRSFSNPINNTEQFSKQSILKLKNIAIEETKSLIPEQKYLFENPQKKFPRTEIQELYTKLLQIINEIEEINNNLTPHAKLLVKLFYSVDKKEKKLIEGIIENVLHLGYYMRGWKVENNELPISESKFPSEKQYEVFANTLGSIKKLELSIENLPEKLKKTMEFLPLMKVQKRGSEISFLQSNTKENGFTILDRVKIVKIGEEDEDSYSCIRLSSNWFLYSGFYYCKVLNLKEPFDVRRMREIS